MKLKPDHGSPLICAIRCNQHAVVDQLLKDYHDARGKRFHLCDLEIRDADGRTAEGTRGMAHPESVHVHFWYKCTSF